MGRNSSNCQNSAWTAEQIEVLRRGVDYLLESVSCERSGVFGRRRRKRRKISVGRTDEATENSTCKINRNRFKKSRCTCCVTLNHNIFLRLFPGYGPMGLDRKQGCGENRVDRIKVTYQNWAGRTRCCWFLCTMKDGEVYCGVSIISN